MNSHLDAIRDQALETVDASESRFRKVIALAGLIETVLLGTFLFLMDFGNTLHWLILVSALLVYATLSVGLVALGAYVRTSTLRILTALDS